MWSSSFCENVSLRRWELTDLPHSFPFLIPSSGKESHSQAGFAGSDFHSVCDIIHLNDCRTNSPFTIWLSIIFYTLWKVYFSLYRLPSLNRMPIRRVRSLSWQSDKILGGAAQPHKTVRPESCSLVAVAVPFSSKRESFCSKWNSRRKTKATFYQSLHTHRSEKNKWSKTKRSKSESLCWLCCHRRDAKRNLNSTVAARTISQGADNIGPSQCSPGWGISAQIHWSLH